MKKIYFWSVLMIIIVFLPASLFAQERFNNKEGDLSRREMHVTSAEALNVGYTFMRTGTGTRGEGTRSSEVRMQNMQLVYTGRAIDSLTRATTDCYYVFALQPKGFVIVAADSRVEPILGYSYDNNFAVENMPAHVRGWLNGYERQIEYAVKQNVAPEAEMVAKWSLLKSGQAVSMRNRNTVGPLLTTTWDQGQYYNSLCPTDANGPAGHALTGCVATALAQIINYHQYPQHGRGIHRYNSNYGTLTVDYNNANYNYSIIPNNLTVASTSTEVNAVATLMRDCGVAVNMRYAADESSSFDQEARAALINYFKYSPDASFAEKSYFTNDEWETMLRNDLDAGNPVYYAGQGTGGHAFVCDGYNDNGYFSFNFGWGGYCNGWYLTSSVTPGGNDFSNSQSAIFGITPAANGSVILGQSAGTSTFTVDGPLEFYHLMGHNAYEVGNYSNPCNSTVHFISANNAHPIVADIIDYEDQSLTFYDGDGNALRNMYGGGSNDLSPVVSNNNTLSVSYSGNMYCAGFILGISQTDGCRRVSNISTQVDTTTVHITWTENGSATQWEIEYGVKGFEMGSGTVYIATTNTVTFSELPEFTEYDFYIRPVCGDNQYGFQNKVTVMIEAKYWQDIVTSQPAGYVYDAATNSVQISTAEQLVWWAKTGDCADGHLAADIDLSGYKWRPTDLYHRNFNGHGHVLTNVYVRESNMEYCSVFFGCRECILENLGITNSYVESKYGASGLVNEVGGIMRNCYVANTTVIGGDRVGGLVISNYGLISNCFVNANVMGNRWVGLMSSISGGGISGGTIRNCYAAGSVRMLSWCYNAGISSYTLGGEITNCYSVPVEFGVVGYAADSLFADDTSTFVKSEYGCTLLTPVDFDEIVETDLLSALNRGLEIYNDSVYCVWVADTDNVNGGYPVFGDRYVVQCPNVSEVSVQNITENNNHAVWVSWANVDDASQWCIRYRRHDKPDTAYNFVFTTNNSDTLYGIALGYEYDFNVREICDANHRSGWSETKTLLVDLPYWTDVVTTQPSGYVEDADGNVEISSAEGLAWLAVVTNGFHNQQMNTFEGKTVTLKADVNLAGYRWYPIGNSNNSVLGVDGFAGVFDGQNYKVSNIYMHGNSGLFGYVYLARVKNVNLNGGLVVGSGGLIGTALDCYEISNCHSSATIYGGGGALCGEIDNHNGQSVIKVFNCSSSGTVFGREGCGSLFGRVGGKVEISNCFATGEVKISSSRGNTWYRGGLIGYTSAGASVCNCFSIGNVEIDDYSTWFGKVLGCLDYNPSVHYIYGQDNVNEGWSLIGNLVEDVSNMAQFHHDGNTNALINTVSIDGTICSDLLDALNAWVVLQNDPTLRLWILDTLTGYPVFGDYFVPSCYNPTDLVVSQATEVGSPTIKTRLSWTQEGEPDHWEVLYVATGQGVESGTVVPVYNNSCVLVDIPVGQPLDFYVRAVCEEGDTSNWCYPVTYLPDKLRWTEVVTSQPEGYRRDFDGYVYISSAEGLAWLSSVANGLNGTQGQYSIGTIVLTKDIDMSAYRWTPIGHRGMQCYASFNGNNHVLSGLYCNELSEYQGLFGWMEGQYIKNLILTQCNVIGTEYIGIIAGYCRGKIINCLVNGDVLGYGRIGGLVGDHHYSNVENSCFIGNVASGQNIRNITSSMPSGYAGGICGPSSYHTTANCYVVSDFSDIGSYCTGIITSTAYLSSDVSYCYYKENETNLPIASGNMSNNSDFAGNYYTWTLNTPPYVNGVFRTDLVDALNSWVDENNTDGQYLRWVADTNMVNGGYPIFESILLPAVTAQDTVVAQGYYSWHGKVFTSDTVLTDTLYTLNGYDSVVTYHIHIVSSPLTDIIVDTCSSYSWNDEIYYENGDYVQTFLTANRADSVVILHLTISPLTGVDEQVVCDNSYTWMDGVTYTANNNTATYTLQTADGCDSVVTLNLTFGHSNTSDTTVVTCNSYDWYEYTNLTQSGYYARTLTNVSGCDSVVTLHLTINHSTEGVDVQVACDSFTWMDSVTYIESTNEPTYILTNAAGCDSIVTLHLTINHSSIGETTMIACDSYTYNGTTFTESGDYLLTLTNAAGCDSLVTLHLTVNYSVAEQVEVTACDSYTWNDSIYTQSGDYTRTFTAANGCDSIVTLHLIINHSVTEQVEATACDSYTWNDSIYTQSGDYTRTFIAANGCDSVVTLHLIINHPNIGETTVVACDSYTCNGTTFTESGDYLLTLTNAVGCDSLVTLHLTVNYSVTEQVEATACDSYNWNDSVYTQSGDYTRTFTADNGCDSVVTLHLTINYPVAEQVEATACDSYTWNGTTYTESGDYPLTLTNATGCDSVVTLHLILYDNEFSEFTITTNEPCYTWNGVDYCESGDFTQTLETVHGCDSIVTLHLTIGVGIANHDGFNFKVYPNPTSNIVNVEFEMGNGESGDVKIQLYDVLYGKLLNIVETRHGTSLQTEQIDLSRYANGVYFIKAVGNGKTIGVRKVVRQ